MIPPPGHPGAQERPWPIRRAACADRDAALALYELNKSGGMAEPNDDAPDLHDFEACYLSEDSGSRFWVIENDADDIVGMVGVRRHNASQAAVRRLHVHPEYRQQGIGTQLVEEALQFCHDQGYVKIVLEMKEDQRAAIALFKRFGFRLNRVKNAGGAKKLEFYIDLYYNPDAANQVNHRKQSKQQS